MAPISDKPATPQDPDRVFGWHGLDGPLFPKLAAVAVTVVAFGLFLILVRVEVAAPSGWVESKAAVIHLPENGEGRTWRLRALEGGPSPARFDPADWQGTPRLEQMVLAAGKLPATPYVPMLRPLPSAPSVPRVPLTSPGQPVFPDRPAAPPTAAAPAHPKLAPVLYPLAGIYRDQLPGKLPALELADPSAGAEEWRFLLRLGPAGAVAETFALTNPDHPAAATLSAWLRSVQFPATAPEGWISLAVGFSHRPANDPDAR